MATDVDSCRQTGYVCGCGFYIDGKRRCHTAEALRPDIGFVDSFKQLAFHLGVGEDVDIAQESGMAALEQAGFTVAVNRDLPPNDGCISFGQAVVAWASSKEEGEQPCA